MTEKNSRFVKTIRMSLRTTSISFNKFLKKPHAARYILNIKSRKFNHPRAIRRNDSAEIARRLYLNSGHASLPDLRFCSRVGGRALPRS